MVRDMNHAEIYASELVRLRFGHPLWHPELSQCGEVEIGDVGYIRDGTFIRLFNATREGGDAMNGGEVPQGFVQLEVREVRTQKNLVRPGDPLSSESTKEKEMKIEAGATVGVVNAGASSSFTLNRKRGAVAILSDGGVQEKVVRSAAFTEYIYRHHQSWHKFAVKQGHDVRAQDIVLVSGYIKTAGWALAAYDNQDTGHSFSVTLSANGVVNLSPSFNTADTHRPGLQQRESSPARSLGPQDQCVFVQYYKCLPKRLGATCIRRPENLKESDMQEHVPNECFCAPFASVRRWFRNHFGNCCCCCGDEEPEVEEKPAQPQMSEPEDPVASVLQYIAKKYPTKVAVAGHSDLYSLLHGVNWPESVSTYLAEKQPKILRDASGAHLLVQDTEDIQDIANVREPPSPRSVRTQEPPSPWKVHAPTLGRPMKARGLNV